MQVYRGMDIGTAKPSAQERASVRHHMIDLVEPEATFSVADFRAAARSALKEEGAELVLIVGGSGLHFRSVVDHMTFRPTDPALRAQLEQTPNDELVDRLLESDPDAADLVDLSNPRRVLRALETLELAGLTPSAWAASEERRLYRDYVPELEFTGLAIDRADLDVNIHQRLKGMRAAGLFEEVKALADRLGPTAAQAVGYRQLLPAVAGRVGLDDAFAEIERATMALVKRQRTFFRRDPRLDWLDGSRPDLVAAVLERAKP